jgi:NAD(P)-dependent dehydrogenase (short-subunit alcohol dehydrogenase family)
LVSKQHVALVTGASRGIGAAIVEKLASRGIACVNLDRRPPNDVSKARYIEVDLSDSRATQQALASVNQKLDVLWLVNNAGIVAPALLEDTRLEDFDLVTSVNLRASIQCAQAVLPTMKAAGRGRIVNISSRAALGKELRTVYAATKAGLIGLTRTWALELGRYGVTVNAVAPGPIDTDLFRHVNPADSPRTKAIIDGIPVRRLGTVDDVAHAVCFLLDDESSFITGQTLHICGGMSVGTSAI